MFASTLEEQGPLNSNAPEIFLQWMIEF